MTVTDTIIRDVCETDPADADLHDTVCISVDDLRLIIENNLAPTQGADGESLRPAAIRSPDWLAGWATCKEAWDMYGFFQTAEGTDARPVAMTNGSFHCPACGETMKGPLACGHCLWQKPEAVDAEIGADGIAAHDAAPRTDDARPVVIYQEQDCSGHWIDIPRIRYNMIPNPLWKRIVYTTRMDEDRHE